LIDLFAAGILFSLAFSASSLERVRDFLGGPWLAVGTVAGAFSSQNFDKCSDEPGCHINTSRPIIWMVMKQFSELTSLSIVDDLLVGFPNLDSLQYRRWDLPKRPTFYGVSTNKTCPSVQPPCRKIYINTTDAVTGNIIGPPSAIYTYDTLTRPVGIHFSFSLEISLAQTCSYKIVRLYYYL
jgi:hypothetical protein